MVCGAAEGRDLTAQVLRVLAQLLVLGAKIAGASLRESYRQTAKSTRAGGC